MDNYFCDLGHSILDQDLPAELVRVDTNAFYGACCSQDSADEYWCKEEKDGGLKNNRCSPGTFEEVGGYWYTFCPQPYEQQFYDNSLNFTEALSLMEPGSSPCLLDQTVPKISGSETQTLSLSNFQIRHSEPSRYDFCTFNLFNQSMEDLSVIRETDIQMTLSQSSLLQLYLVLIRTWQDDSGFKREEMVWNKKLKQDLNKEYQLISEKDFKTSQSNSQLILELVVVPQYRMNEEKADLADTDPVQARDKGFISEFSVEYSCLKGVCIPGYLDDIISDYDAGGKIINQNTLFESHRTIIVVICVLIAVVMIGIFLFCVFRKNAYKLKSKQLKMHPAGPYNDPKSGSQEKDDQEKSSSQNNSMSHLIDQSNLNQQMLDDTQFSKIEAKTLDCETKKVSKIEARFQSQEQQKPKTKLNSNGASVLESLYGNKKIMINPLCQSHNFEVEDSFGGDSRSMLFAKGSPVAKDKYDHFSSIRESIFFKMIPNANSKVEEPQLQNNHLMTPKQKDHSILSPKIQELQLPAIKAATKKPRLSKFESIYQEQSVGHTPETPAEILEQPYQTQQSKFLNQVNKCENQDDFQERHAEKQLSKILEKQKTGDFDLLVIENENYLEQGTILCLDTLQSKKIMIDGTRIQHETESDWIQESNNYDDKTIQEKSIRYRIRLAFRKVFIRQRDKQNFQQNIKIRIRQAFLRAFVRSKMSQIEKKYTQNNDHKQLQLTFTNKYAQSIFLKIQQAFYLAFTISQSDPYHIRLRLKLAFTRVFVRTIVENQNHQDALDFLDDAMNFNKIKSQNEADKKLDDFDEISLDDMEDNINKKLEKESNDLIVESRNLDNQVQEVLNFHDQIEDQIDQIILKETNDNELVAQEMNIDNFLDEQDVNLQNLEPMVGEPTRNDRKVLVHQPSRYSSDLQQPDSQKLNKAKASQINQNKRYSLPQISPQARGPKKVRQMNKQDSAPFISTSQLRDETQNEVSFVQSNSGFKKDLNEDAIIINVKEQQNLEMAAKIVQTYSLEDGGMEIIGLSEPGMQQGSDLSNTSPIDLESNKFIREFSNNVVPPKYALNEFENLDDVELAFNQTAREVNRGDQNKIGYESSI